MLENAQPRRVVQTWAQQHNRDHLVAGRNGMRVIHDRADDGCNRTVERLYLRPDRKFGWWVQVKGKWTRQHPPGGTCVLRCQPDHCGLKLEIVDALLLGAMFRAAENGRDHLYVSELSPLAAC